MLLREQDVIQIRTRLLNKRSETSVLGRSASLLCYFCYHLSLINLKKLQPFRVAVHVLLKSGDKGSVSYVFPRSTLFLK